MSFPAAKLNLLRRAKFYGFNNLNSYFLVSYEIILNLFEK